MHDDNIELYPDSNINEADLLNEAARRVMNELPLEKLADAILDHPGLLDALINYSRKRAREKSAQGIQQDASQS